MTPAHRRLISGWLFLLCFMLLGMIAIGGVTRLTGSGLSIMDWQPVSGFIPPLSHAEWERLFALYQTIPQYHLQHEGFGLAGFQKIFWAEWIHRFWGRLMGLVLLVPLVWFTIKGMMTRALALRLFAFFILGALQGAIGWFMVASGFRPDSTAVEPVRLVLHLSAALLLYAAILWTAFSVRWPRTGAVPDAAAARPVRLAAGVATALLCTTIVAGGFTAGTHAGFLFNTFPLMDGHLIPTDYASLSPFWLNWFANKAAVQFDHRLLATLTALSVAATLLVGLRAQGLGARARNALVLLGWAVGIQYALGVTTLLLVVPVWAGAVHQTFAAVLLGTMLYVLHSLRSTPTR
ncbi:COX15/CtaA family protein [Acetobacter sp. TBRC 12305]|uniref:Heme A synthase n=1 Tax=Acetobacter garciniae TaxID=2817435 RepID=A0A939HP10_9PROT|nr:COX15/CtaA family protein [Acetobacter garciniae]MBO1324574.1 COX15/CtaA family protein [Acetobacter garciniae]MBX0344263.1 COX15/CtaA family protein [Acetobacter garciniae]